MTDEETEHIWKLQTLFKDGIRKIDFVLVANIVRTRDEMNKLQKYIENLSKQGVEFETALGIKHSNFIFIKLHLPENKLFHFAEVYNISLMCRSKQTHFTSHRFKCNIFETILTKPDPKGPLYHRAPGTLSGKKPVRITSCERSLIISRLLQRATFSSNTADRGVEKLIKTGVLVDAYPLHDDLPFWTTTGPLSDRQLLYKYWVNLKYWYKNQPLNLIHKYFGPQVSFYFAFADFYIKMLLPASAIGLLVFIYNLLTYSVIDTARITEVCKSNLLLCPYCFNPKYCGYKQLTDNCPHAKLTAIFDSIMNVMFAIIMSFWSTVFIELWRRRETELRYRWNLINITSDSAARLEFSENTKYRRISKISGEIEPYIPWYIKLYNYSITVLSCLFVLCIIVLGIFGNILFKITISRAIKAGNNQFLKRNVTIIIMCISSLVTCIYIKLLTPFYTKLAVILTKRENPRTLVEYSNSYIYKSYMLSFFNTYLPIIYCAFLKGAFFTYPGDEEQFTQVLGVRADMCQPSGCLVSLSNVLLFILILKTFVARILASIIMTVKAFWRRRKILKVDDHLPSWEREYSNVSCGQFFVVRDYMEISIQYGLVTFFVAALPLAPLLALLTSIIELREDARKYCIRYKRPVSWRLPGIGAWNSIFRLATYMGTVTNAFVIAFTSDIIGRELYRNKHHTLSGYVFSSLSLFNVSDFKTNTTILMKNRKNVSTCVYKAMRNPPNHEEKYELSEDYWEQLSIKLGFVVVFEQIIWVLTGICATVIADTPSSILQEMNDEQIKAKEVKYKKLQDTLQEKKLESNYEHFQIQ